MPKLLLAAIISLLLFSCKKSQTSSPTVPKIKYWSWSMGAIYRHAVFEFSYDNQERVTSIFIHFGEYQQPVTSSDTIYYCRFYYNGNDHLPYYLVQTGDPATYETWYFNYDSQGRVIKDSMPADLPNQYIVDYYDQNSNYFRRRHRISTWEYDSVATSNSNYLSYYNNNSGHLYKMISLDYDNNINPLYHLNISPLFPIMHLKDVYLAATYSLWLFGGANNLTTASDYGAPDPTDYRYIYNSNNFPEKRISKVYDSGSGFYYPDTVYYHY